MMPANLFLASVHRTDPLPPLPVQYTTATPLISVLYKVDTAQILLHTSVLFTFVHDFTATVPYHDSTRFH